MAGRSQAKQKRVAKEDLGDSSLATVSIPGVFTTETELEFRDFLALIFAAASALQAGRRQVARQFDLSATELAVFLAASKLDGLPSVGQIAQHLRVSATNVTTDVNRLVKAGLLEKFPNPDDARAVQIGVTKAGKGILRQATPILREANNRLFSGLSRNDVNKLRVVLEQMIRASNSFSVELRERISSL